MTGLELELRVDQFTRNAKVATDSLKQVGDQAVATQTTISTASGKMTNAFAVGTSGISAASAIASTASSMRSLNSEMAVLSGSRALLELGRLGSELGSVSTRGGVVGRVLGGAASLAARTGPWIALAGAVVSVGSAFFSMGENVEKSTDAINKQSKALDDLLARTKEIDIRKGFGQADPRLTAGGTVDALTAVATSGRSTFGVSQAASLFGIDEQSLRYALARGGAGEGALELTQPRIERDIYTGQPFRIPGGRFARDEFSRDEVLSAGRILLDQRRNQPSGESPYRRDPDYGTGDLLRTGEDNRFTGSFDRVRINPEQQASMDRDAKRAQDAMDQLNRQAQQFGDYMGDAFFNAVSGAQSLRQIMHGIVSDFARQGFRAGFSGLFSAIGGGFGETPAPQQP